MESLQSMETITEVWNTNTLKQINMCDTPYYKVVEEPYKQVKDRNNPSDNRSSDN